MSEEHKHYLYRTDRSRWESDEQLLKELKKRGVQIDQEFGVVSLDEAGQSVVLRGVSTEKVNIMLQKKFEIDAFVDVPVGPMSKK